MPLFLFLSCSALYCFIMTSWLTHAHLGDFYVYLTAAQALHQSINPYLTLQHWHLGPERLPSIYFYPPLLIILLEKLLFLGTSTLRELWVASSILCIPVAALFLGTAITGRTSSFSHLLILLLLAVHPATYDGLYFGQVDCFVLLLLSATLYCITTLKHSLSGLFLGLSIALKLSPVFLGLSLIGKDRLKSFLTMTLVVLSSLFLSVITPRGLELLDDFSAALRNLGSGQYFFGLPGNLSFAKLLVSFDLGMTPRYASLAGQILAVILVLSLAFRSGLNSSSKLSNIFNASIPCMIIASPITWYHHLLWLLIPHCWIVLQQREFLIHLLSWIAFFLAFASLPLESYLATTTYPEAASYLGATLVSLSSFTYWYVFFSLKNSDISLTSSPKSYTAPFENSPLTP